MKMRILSARCMRALAGVVFALPAGAVLASASDGLVPVISRNLDQVEVRPNADLQQYRQVIIDPAEASMKKGWLKSVNGTRGPSRWLVPEDMQNITDSAAASLSNVVADSFRSRGFEIVTTPGAGVLRVSPRLKDLNVYAPDVSSAYMQALFNIDAGEATLSMEIRDSATGTLLGRVVDRGTARELSSRINRAFQVTNVMWFDVLFRQWTANCFASLEFAKLSN